jgi:hypothetical protein
MKLDDALHSIRDRIQPPRDGRLGNFLKVAAGTAAAVWVVLQLRRELYGPGGTKMSPYDPEVDDVWDEEDEKAKTRRKHDR